MSEAPAEVSAPAEVKPKGVKETLEFIAGLKVVVPLGVEVAADKKISTKDIKPVVESIKKYDVVVEAIKGAGEIIPEVKDLDTAELAQIGAAAVELFRDAKAAYERGK